MGADQHAIMETADAGRSQYAVSGIPPSTVSLHIMPLELQTTAHPEQHLNQYTTTQTLTNNHTLQQQFGHHRGQQQPAPANNPMPAGDSLHHSLITSRD